MWKSQDEDHDDVESLDEGIEAAMSHGKSPDANHDASPSDAVTGTVQDEPPTTVNEPSTPARADGGTTGLGLEGPPETVADSDVEDADVQEANGDPTVDCPNCGADTGTTAADLEKGSVYRCSDCGGKFKWT